MEVQLKNFKCWSSKTVNISPEGMTLIHGRSGKGKSSILEAICFAISGKGKNIVQTGKRSCSVSLTLVDGICITRSKRPNILTVQIPGGDKLEDEAAQGLINKKFTSTFETVAYLKQSGKSSSFVTLSPREKLIFLEELAFRGYDITSLKTAAHELHRDNSEKLLQTSSKIQVLFDQLENLPELKVVKCPIKLSKKETQQTCERKLSTKIERLNRHHQSFSRKKAALLKKLKETIDSEAKEKTYFEALEDSEVTLKQLQTNNFLDHSSEISELKQKINIVEKHAILSKEKISLTKMESELQSIKEEELKKLRDDLAELLSDLWSEGSEKEAKQEILNREQNIEKCRQKDEIAKKLKRLEILDPTTQLKKLREECTTLEKTHETLSNSVRDAVDSSHVHVCPYCDKKLRFSKSKIVKLNVEDQSVLSKNEILRNQKILADTLAEMRFKRKKLAKVEVQKDEVLTLKKQIKGIKIPTNDSISTMKQEKDDWQQYISDNKKSEKEISKIETKINSQIFSSTVTRFTHNIKKARETISNLEKEVDLDDETVLQNDIEVMQQNLRKLLLKQQEYEVHTKSLNKVNATIKNLKTKIQSLEIPESSKEIEKKISELTEKEEKIQQSIQKIQKIHGKIQKYFAYQKSKQIMNSLDDQLKDLTLDETTQKDFSASSEKLRTKIKEAESKCLETFVWSLQNAVQLYLDDFFPHDPISINISRFKTTKTKKQTKPEIHITFSYKGQEFDYQSLSGGELQRVVLAFTLALAEKFNAPFIMLDESTSNLDQELTNLIVDTIHKYHSCRPVVLVAHQVVTGVFENMVEI